MENYIQHFLVRCKSEINTTYNEKGLEEINAKSSTKVNSTADIILTKNAKMPVVSSIIVSMTFLILAGGLIYFIKIQIDKIYNIYE